MVRAPCCEKMGLKKGPWTTEEDQILINYIHLHGHGNWRALPKQAGLLRCGKSCRLRWTNYLRPDIKRGNFTTEEEDTIIKLHEMLGNRWSAIAARLPGRTDNEIKNVWHTHLKKRLNNKSTAKPNEAKREMMNKQIKIEEEEKVTEQQSSSEWSDEVSSSVTTSNNNNNRCASVVKMESDDGGVEMDDDFWSEVLSADNSVLTSVNMESSHLIDSSASASASACNNVYDSMDFWYNIFTRSAGELLELPEI